MNNKRLIYSQNDFPVFQNIRYDNYIDAINSPTGDIRLVEDCETGLVYNDSFNPLLVEYNEKYQNEQSTSDLFKRHLKNVSVIIKRFFVYKKIVEIGCGKGIFLEMLQQDGFDVIGFDKTYEGTIP